MRSMLVTAVFLAGCLHARAPKHPEADPADVHAFTLLIDDASRIGEAKTYADKHGLTTEALAMPALRAYERLMRLEDYVHAAEIAWRFGLGKAYRARPMALQRQAAADGVGRFLLHKDDAYRHGARYQAAQELGKEAVIACGYSADPKDGQMAVSDAVGFRLIASDDSVLYPLLDAGCPVDAELLDRIIRFAYAEKMDAFAIRHAARAGWGVGRTYDFVWNYFHDQRCDGGFKAAVALKIADSVVMQLVEASECEDEDIDSSGWALKKKDANAYFFAAVRRDKCNLAFELLPHGDLGDDGRTFLFQEAARHGAEYALMKALRFHPKEHDLFMRYAYERGRYRFIGNFSRTMEWQRKAFDKLIELGKWEDAAEAAQYGVSEGLRTEGVLIAFRAAMAGGDFKSGRYFVARYGPVKDKPGLVTQEMYEGEKDKWYAAKQAGPDPAWMKDDASKAKRKRKKRKPPCPDDDWCP